MKPQFLPLLLVLGLPSCFIPQNATPLLDTNVGAVSQYNFRGVPYDEKGALQGDVTIAMPTTRDGGTVALNVFSNVAISNSNSGGVLGSDNARDVTRSDYTFTYSEPLESFDLTLGVTHYTYPGNGRPSMPSMYANAVSYPSISTTQLFGAATWDRWDLAPTVEVFLDVDAAGGFYINGHLTREFDWKEDTWIETRANLAFVDSGYAEEYYGNDKTTFADLGVSGAVMHQYNDNTILSASLNVSTLPDSSLGDNLEAAGIDTTNVWIGFNAHWAW